MTPAENDWTALEQRVARLESAWQDRCVVPPPPPGPDDGGPDDGDPYWVVTGIQDRIPAPGAVLYAGSVELPAGGRVAYQYGLPAGDLLETDWSSFAPAIAALGHPSRLALLRAALAGTTTTQGLLEVLGGTTGQLYHHVNPLIAAGWLQPHGRGRYQVPPARVVAVLAVIVAARH